MQQIQASAFCLALVGLFAYTTSSLADIYRWDTGELIPGTAGITPGPGIDLSGWNTEDGNLRYASFYDFISPSPDADGEILYNLAEANFDSSWLEHARFQGAELSGASFERANLTYASLASSINFIPTTLVNADFGAADLTRATLQEADLTGANLHDAIITRTNFGDVRGFTKDQLYSTASYQAMDLEGITFTRIDLTGWDLHGQNIADAAFDASTLTNVNLANAVITDASFSNVTSRGFSKEQLYSTASYQENDLRGVRLDQNDLSGWDFTGKNLNNASLGLSILTDAIFTGAQVTGAAFGPSLTAEQLYSTASYQGRDLQGIGLAEHDLTGWDFGGQNLTGATLHAATLTGVNLTGAVIAEADFSHTTSRGFTTEQLYSTASYQATELQGVSLAYNDLTGWGFTGQDVRAANFSGSNFSKEQLYSTSSYQAKDLKGIGLDDIDLSGWDLSGQNLKDGVLGGQLTNADFSGADLRGADYFGEYFTLDDHLMAAITRNLIRQKGIIRGLHLTRDEELVIRDDDGLPPPDPAYGWLSRPPIAVTVDDHFLMDQDGTLQLLFESDDWGSLISFKPAIPVQLGGTLELAFTDDVDVATQLGRTLHIFDWTGVAPTGMFQVESPYLWDVSDLYSTGEIRLTGTGIPADHNANGIVEQRDLDLVLTKWGETIDDPAGVGWYNDLPMSVVDQEELDKVLANWGAGHNFASTAAAGTIGAVPEPSTLVLVFCATACLLTQLCGTRRVVLGTAALCAFSLAMSAQPATAQIEYFRLEEATLADINRALDHGIITSEQLVQLYLNRIEAYEEQGPQLNAFITVNPNALETAHALDLERRTSGPRGPLHGIPIAVKDIFDTSDMPTTAGLLALADSMPPDDGYVVRTLREAGAIILGKTNQNDLGIDASSTSSIAGRTANPYDTRRSAGGSSSGSGVAAAANLAAVAVGGDTGGSVRIPSALQNLVGLKPTHGLVSREGAIDWQIQRFVSGPMTRTVSDAAVLLDALAGPDPADPTTHGIEQHIPPSYTDSLNVNGLQGARIGLISELIGGTSAGRDVLDQAIADMRSLGATVLDTLDTAALAQRFEANKLRLFSYLDMEFEMNRYFESLGPDAPIHSMDELIASGEYLPGMSQWPFSYLRGDQPPEEDPEFEAVTQIEEQLRAEALRIMEEHDLDALLYPTVRSLTSEPTLADANTMLASFTRLPAISLPAGGVSPPPRPGQQETFLPIGIELMADPFTEPTLISLAYAYEQATQHRRAPVSAPPLSGEVLLAGDYSGDGVIDQNDLALVLAHWGTAEPAVPAGWVSGAPVGVVDQAELDRILLGWGSTVASLSGGAVATHPVPEPAAAVLAAGAGLLVVLLSGLRQMARDPPQVWGQTITALRALNSC